MNREESIKLLALIKVAYPTAKDTPMTRLKAMLSSDSLAGVLPEGKDA